MEIGFQKMHGTMNDFVVFDDLHDRVHLTGDEVAAICHRRSGVGADGVIVVRPSTQADFFMDYVNADGSIGEMCGNGIRCLAKYVFDNGLTDKTVLSVETRAGNKELELMIGALGRVEKVRVDMGKPVFNADSIPVRIDSGNSPFTDYPISIHGRDFSASILSMGNPHCVIFVEDDPGPLPVQYGPAIEHHELFPQRTNVEFVRVVAPDRLIMRVWERGSGETFSCGTGACAAAVAAGLKGLCGDRTTVEVLGGELNIEWKGATFSVVMTGSSVLVYNGIISI